MSNGCETSHNHKIISDYTIPHYIRNDGSVISLLVTFCIHIIQK
jgi:hypothetical protein